METFISITEMAKLRSVTTETLRYYDRIGLLKPDYLDDNHVRYYSVLKYEQLETIKELQQMGLNLKEIGQYLSNWKIRTSYELLLKQQEYCAEKIRFYKSLEEKITRKVSLLSGFQHSAPERMKPEITELPNRYFLSANCDVWDETSLGYGCMQLEQKLKEQDALIPVYASDCYAGLFSFHSNHPGLTRLIFLLDKAEKLPAHEISTIPAGTFLHLYSSGSFWDRTEVLNLFHAFASDHQLTIDQEVLVISKIDYSITDIPEERLYEFQVRVLSNDKYLVP